MVFSSHIFLFYFLPVFLYIYYLLLHGFALNIANGNFRGKK